MSSEIVLPSGIAWTIIVIFSILWIFLGWWLGRKNKTVEDHMLAGRKVGMGLAVATAMAT